MQEKVTLTPPEIKLFEGKTPPSSWFNENVVKYLQVKSESEFLTNFLAYAKQLQSEKVAKAIPQAANEPEMVEVPEKATSQDAAKIFTLNSLQPSIKTEIESLEKLIVLLQQANPKLTKELSQLLTQIKMAAKAFPALSEEQLKLLTKTVKQLDEEANKLPLSSQRKYWEKEFSMLYEIWEHMDQFVKDSQEQSSQLKKDISTLEELSKGLQNLGSLLAKKGGQNLTNQELQQILAFLQTLSEGHSKLPAKEQNALTAFMEKLSDVKGKNNKMLSQPLSDRLLMQWIEEFLKSHPNASGAQVKDYIKSLLDESNLSKTTLPFLQDIGDAISSTMNAPGFPMSKGHLDIFFSIDQNGQIVPNGNFAKELERNFTLDPQAANELEPTRLNALSAVKNGAATLQKLHEGHLTALATAQDYKGRFGAASATAAANGNLSGSLPNEFRQAILGHYMPEQEAYLMELAEMLYFANFGAEMGNTLLNKMLDFGEAANNYDFSSFLHSDSTGQFSGSYADAKAQLANEQNQVSTDLHKVSDSLNYIQSEINKIQSNPNLTADQKAKMIKQLNGYANDLKACQSQLQTLKTTLDGLSVQKGSDANHFTVSGPAGWQTNLSTQENTVINGNPQGNPPGGLLNIQSTVQADQQSYSDQSQNQQMVLQMRMTEIQQEWTVVSDSLQALNQMYMSCAQAIYK